MEEKKAKKGAANEAKNTTKLFVTAEENKPQNEAVALSEAKEAEKVSASIPKEPVKTEEKEQDKVIEIKAPETNTVKPETKADTAVEKTEVEVRNNTKKTTSKRTAKKTTSTPKVKKPRPSKRAKK